MAEAQVRMFLAQLGTTPDEVAAALQARRVQGVRNAVRFLNPIVRYLQHLLRLDSAVLDVIPGDRVRMHFEGGRKAAVPLPESVWRFLDGFNRGDYPELELPPEDSC